MGSRDAVILGYDAVSALGLDLEEQWQAALSGAGGIGPLTRFPLPDDFPVTIAGQVPDIDDELVTGKQYSFLSAREQAAWSSPVFRYSMLTVARALERSGLEITAEIAPRVALTYSSAIGGLDAVLAADRRLHAALRKSQFLYQHGRRQDCHYDGSPGPDHNHNFRLRHRSDLHACRRHAAGTGQGGCGTLRGR